jgi:hypothetical protein
MTPAEAIAALRDLVEATCGHPDRQVLRGPDFGHARMCMTCYRCVYADTMRAEQARHARAVEAMAVLEGAGG